MHLAVGHNKMRLAMSRTTYYFADDVVAMGRPYLHDMVRISANKYIVYVCI